MAQADQLTLRYKELASRFQAEGKRGDVDAQLNTAEELVAVVSQLDRLNRQHLPDEEKLHAMWGQRLDELLSFQVGEYQSRGEFSKAAGATQLLANLYADRHGPTDPETLEQKALVVDYTRAAHLPKKDQSEAVEVFSSLVVVFADDDKDEAPDRRLQTRQRLWEQSRRLLGEDSYTVALAGFKLGFHYLDAGNHQAAASVLEPTVKNLRKLVGEQADSFTLSAINGLAAAYLVIEDYAAARQYCESGLEISLRDLGSEDARVIIQRQALARNLLFLEAYDEAREQFEHALALSRKLHGDDHEITAELRSELGGVCVELADYSTAERLLKEALQSHESLFGKDSPEVGNTCNHLGLMFDTSCRPVLAIPYFRRALKCFLATHGEEHENVTTCLVNLGNAEAAIGRHDAAGENLLRAIKICNKVYDREHPETANAMEAWGSLLIDVGDYEDAIRFLRLSLSIYQEVYGPTHNRTIGNMGLLARALNYSGETEQARDLLKEAIDKVREKHGKQVPLEYWGLANTLALLYADAQQPKEALALYDPLVEWIDAEPETIGADPEAMLLRHNRAIVLVQMGKWQEAMHEFDVALKASRINALTNVLLLSEREQLEYLSAFRIERIANHALALNHRDSQEMVDKSAEWVINSKGMTQQVLAARSVLSRSSDTYKAIGLSRQIASLRQQQTQLTLYKTQDIDADSYRQQLDAIDRRLADLSAEFGKINADVRLKSWTVLPRLRRWIPEDAVLIEVVRFEQFDFATRELRQDRYAAWIIPKKGNGQTRLIDLGLAKEIDRAVIAWRESISAGSGSLRGDRRRRPQENPSKTDPGQSLRRLVIEPLLPHISDSQHWLINPDSALWLVSWAALPLDDEHYVVERHRVSYLTSSRDLIYPKLEHALPDRTLVIADPDFDFENKSPESNGGIQLATRGPALLSGESIPTDWARLPGTAKEAKAADELIQAFVREDRVMLTGAQARESAFKAVQRPRVVVLSTHGFCLSDQNMATNEPTAHPLDRERHRRLMANPLLRCGLVLAGANRRLEGGLGSDEDGILTGLEIVGTNLQGTELVVLSACETGVGEVTNGEGVAGLRQAFQLAGAKAVVSTLWKIPDDESALLMAAFWKHLAEGKSRSSALRQAQLEAIERLRERDDSARPFLWAAFTMTGRPRDKLQLTEEEATMMDGRLQQGIQALNEGDLDTAIFNLRQVIRARPDSTEALGFRGLAYARKGLREYAAADFTEIIRLNPKFTRPYMERGDMYLASRMYDHAIRDATAAIGLNPKLPRAYALRGASLAGKGEFDGALADLNEAIRLAPRYPFALSARGEVFRRQGNLEQAIADQTAAIQQSPKFALAWRRRAAAYQAQGDEEKAAEDQRTANQLEPTEAD